MKVLIAYGTTEGQTKKIAHHIEAALQSDGHSSILLDCASTSKSPDLNLLDAVIIAGSVHDKRHQRGVVAFTYGQRKALQAMPSAFISVSLSIITEGGEVEAQKYVDDFVAETGWTPSKTHLAAGAVRFLEYDFFKEFTVKQIVLRGHDAPSRAEGNPEYTDWKALDAFVRTFLENVAS